MLLVTFLPDNTVNVDASLTGSSITDGKTPSWGKWDENEITHTNVLELKAIQFSVLTYCKDKNLNHIKIISENTTVIYIKKKRGLKSHECNKIAKEIWIWCTSIGLHISAAHIPGTDNFEAHKNSRTFQEATELQLNLDIQSCVWHFWYARNWLICQSDQQTNWKICLLKTRTRSFCIWCFFCKLGSPFHVHISSHIFILILVTTKPQEF